MSFFDTLGGFAEDLGGLVSDYGDLAMTVGGIFQGSGGGGGGGVTAPPPIAPYPYPGTVLVSTPTLDAEVAAEGGGMLLTSGAALFGAALLAYLLLK